MACFPFFVDLKGVPGLVIGGGRVALGKVERLLPFGPRLTVTAPAILPELEAVPGLTLRRRPFREEDLDPQDFDEEDQDLFLEEEDEEDDLPEEDSLEQAGA